VYIRVYVHIRVCVCVRIYVCAYDRAVYVIVLLKLIMYLMLIISVIILMLLLIIKQFFIMNEVEFLKVGGAGTDNPPCDISFNPANIAGSAVGVYITPPVEGELL